MEELAQFHFIRPLWLILLPIVISIGLWFQRSYQPNTGFEEWIDKELLQYLQKNSGQQKQPWSYKLFMVIGCIAIIAIAGPVWKKSPQPLHQSERALIIILDLSPSMLAQDNKPSRLVRARLKIQDILQQRKDGLTGLIVYGGEAHVVTPLTNDTKTITNLLSSLEPGILPIPGSNIEMAIQSGNKLFNDSAIPKGDFLVVTDGIDKSAGNEIKNLIKNNGLFILGVGTPQGAPIPSGESEQGQFLRDQKGNMISAARNDSVLKDIANNSNGYYLPLQADDSDVQFISQQLERNSRLQKQKKEQQQEFTADQWQEFGPTLLLLVLPLFAFYFRRGWLLGLLIIMPITMLPDISHAASLDDPTRKEQSWSKKTWDSLWKNKNQQGQEAFEKEDYTNAQKKFNDHQWRGSAAYRNKDYQSALEAFSMGNTAVDDYNRGNALSQLGKFDEAITAYNSALQKDPSLEDAAKNKELLENLIKQQEQEQRQQERKEQENKNESAQDNSSQEFGEKQENAEQASSNKSNPDQELLQKDNPEKGELEQAESESKQKQEEKEQQLLSEIHDKPLSNEEQQALEQWIRKIPDDPSGLLRRKFNYEFQKRRQLYQAGKWKLPENDAHLRY